MNLSADLSIGAPLASMMNGFKVYKLLWQLPFSPSAIHIKGI